MTKEEYNLISKEILDASISVHREMGLGLLESVYEICLMRELIDRDIVVSRQVGLPLFYKDIDLQKEFKIDLLFENEIIVELKAVEMLLPVHEAQIISYLKLAEKKLGFLVNFNVPLLKQGFKRLVNNFTFVS